MSHSPFYAQPAAAKALTLDGTSGYRIDGDRVLVTIDAISNQRDADNISGTLAVELWALPQPYQGHDFIGHTVAATTIGQIHGQHLLPDCRYDLLYNQPPAGTWQLCLMLREWQDGAFLTRDYINFAAPFTVVAPPAKPALHLAGSEGDNVIKVAFSAASDKTGTEHAVQVTLPRGMDEVIAAKTDSEHPLEKAKQAIDENRVSVNKASLRQLEAIKGVSKKLAKSILDGRPYKRLDDLLRVKGMGKRLLARLEKHLRL